MGKQQQAPGSLELVRSFVNTLDIEQRTERLASPADLDEWLLENDLAGADVRSRPSDLRRAIAVREALRAILASHTDGERGPEEAWSVLREAAERARLTVRFGESGEALREAEAPGVDGALGRLLGIVHEAIAQGAWERLKACRLDSCAWAFYDHTKNRSGAWCNMDVCGNRAKARSYRERHGHARRAASPRA